MLPLDEPPSRASSEAPEAPHKIADLDPEDIKLLSEEIDKDRSASEFDIGMPEGSFPPNSGNNPTQRAPVIINALRLIEPSLELLQGPP